MKRRKKKRNTKKEVRRKINQGKNKSKPNKIETSVSETKLSEATQNQEMQDYYKHIQQRIAQALEKGESIQDVKKELILEEFKKMFDETFGCMGVPREKFFTPEFMAGFEKLLKSQSKDK